jgi:hypothetical protein
MVKLAAGVTMASEPLGPWIVVARRLWRGMAAFYAMPKFGQY